MTLKEITNEQLKEILKKHLAWLNDESGGESADLRSANLRFADLRSADLRSADLRSADLRFADLRSANLRFADLRFADLRFADLRFADLRFADLRSADIDFSAFPLWCGSFGIKVDIRLSAQLAYHFCRLESDDKDTKKAQKALKELANKFHRAEECGKIK